MADTITIPTEDGEKPWKRLSARLRDFNADYPAKDGFRVIFHRTDSLAQQEGLLRLYEAAIRAGHNPAKVGLPPIAPQMIMEARLLDRNGQIIATASAARAIVELKDWERLESSARERLLASLGYHGELVDAEEAEAIGEIAATMPQAPVAAAPGAPPEQDGANSLERRAPPAHVLKQIERLCALRGETPPRFEDAMEALRFLASLREQAPLPGQAA